MIIYRYLYQQFDFVCFVCELSGNDITRISLIEMTSPKLVDTSLKNFVEKQNNSKLIFTPGPASLIADNILGLGPCFGRNDQHYLKIEKRVLQKLLTAGTNRQVRYE